MDSPPDLSPNAPPPPTNLDSPNAYFASLQPPPPTPASSASNDQAPTDGSVDSSGFEKAPLAPASIASTGQASTEGSVDSSGFEKSQDMSTGRDDVLEKTYGDLIDIPKTEPHPEPPKPSAEGEFLGETKPSGTPNLDGSSGDTPHDIHDPKPVETKQADTQPAHDHFHSTHGDAPFEPVGRGGVPLDQLIEDQVAEVHGDVDEILHKVQENDETKHDMPRDRYDVHHSPDDSDTDQPDFRSRTPDVEESTFNRRGPLTIPEIPEKAEIPSEDNFNMDQHEAFSSHGFGIQPRPPTPPKDISEENVKPSAFSLAHGSHTSSHPHHDGLHSILKHSSLTQGGSRDPWIDFKTMDPYILELLHWRDPKKSGVALSLILLVVFIFATYPIISVLAYTGLAVLAGTLGFRVYKTIEAQVKKTSGENPFQEYLSKDLTLPQERIHAQVDVLAEHAVLLANHLKRLIFVENIVDSAKFALILWAMTYIGYWFSGFVLVVLAVLAAFSVPKVYEMYKEPIDAQLAMISQHTKKICTMAEEKLPFLKKLSAEGEKKEQ